MKKTLFVTLALGALCSMPMAWGQDGQPPRGPGGQRPMGGPTMSSTLMAVMPPQAAMMDRLADALQLTDTQTTQLTQILTKGDETARVLNQKAAEACTALRSALLATEYDAQKVKDRTAAAQKAEAAVIGASLDEWTQIRSVLKLNQVASLQTFMSTLRPGRGQFGQPSGFGGQGRPNGQGGPNGQFAPPAPGEGGRNGELPPPPGDGSEGAVPPPPAPEQ